MAGRSQTKGPIGGVVGLVFNKDQCWAILFFFFFFFWFENNWIQFSQGFEKLDQFYF
jgi:hypothetical protein